MEIEKHLTITGNSTVSWKDAIVKAIEEASKTIDYLSSVRILDQYAKIDGNKIAEYFVDLDLSFVLDLNRKDEKYMNSNSSNPIESKKKYQEYV